MSFDPILNILLHGEFVSTIKVEARRWIALEQDADSLTAAAVENFRKMRLLWKQAS